jgi:(S)-ureidoglycine aminohydrolase
MMPLILSKNRTVVNQFYAVITPDCIPESRLPNFIATKVYFHVSPEFGNVRFGQILLKMNAESRTRIAINDGLEHFFFVVEGSIDIKINEAEHHLSQSGYAYVPADHSFELYGAEENTRIIWVKRPYERIHLAGPSPRIAQKNTQPEIPDDMIPGCTAQYLLDEDDLAFDMSMKIIYLEPGAYFDNVETHIMEHGLFMLNGKGIYYLAGDMNEVQVDDFIWMAPYCPQYYVSMWGERTAYLIYKNINRDCNFDC